MTTQIALYLMVSGLLGGLLQALSPNSTWLPWSIPGPVRALAAVLLTAAITGFDQAATGKPLGDAMLTAFVTSAPTWGVLIWQALAALAQARAAASKAARAAERGLAETPPPPPPAAAILLLIGASLLGADGCALFGSPEIKSPCEGLYCLSVEITGVVEPMVCYQTEDEREMARRAALRRGARACVTDGARAVCR